MTNSFSSYQYIPVKDIIQSNIRPNQIDDDIKSLVNVLTPLIYLPKSKLSDESSLHSNIVAKLAEKQNALSLLDYFGYRRNNQGDYIYHSSTSDQESGKRQKGVEEFLKFYNYLKTVKDNYLDDLKRLIQTPNVPYIKGSNTGPIPRKSYSTSNPILPFPNQQEIQEGNTKTQEIIRSLKKNLVTKYNTPPSHSYIRRKVAVELLKQKNPDSIGAGDDCIDQILDQKILSVKIIDRQTNISRTDEVYTECLIRSDFNEKKALAILSHNPPNLTPPVEQSAANQTSKVSFSNSADHLKQHWSLLNQTSNTDSVMRQVLHDDKDKWKNAQHVVPAIQQFRQTNSNEGMNEACLSKLHRLLYSELQHLIGQQLAVKIETLAAILCESSLETIENLDMAAIKNILSSTNDFNDGFGSHAMSFLSRKCPICLTVYPITQIESMLLCSHECCSDCIKNYYRNAINKIANLQSLNKLTCFLEEHEINDDQKVNFLTCLDSKLRQWFRDEPDILDRYHQSVFIAANGEKIRKCGSSKCVEYFAAEENDEEEGINRVLCPHCQFAQCRRCHRKWHDEHDGKECEEYAEWLIENDPDDPDVQTLKYLSKTAIVCPKEDCQEIYQYKAGGCEHFTCERCRTDFCRMCSAFFYVPSKERKCPQTNCVLKTTIHAHCTANCFRETRIGEIDAIIRLLYAHHINVAEELRTNPVSTNNICPVEDCKKPTSAVCENRFCETCYKQFLCSLIWQHGVEPWEIYEDNNLRQMLNKASVAVPEKATRTDLIALCKQNLNQLLGKPKKLQRPKF